MVNPLYIIASFLIAAFASALTDKLSKKLTLGMVLITIAGVITATVYRIWLIQSNPALQSEYFTAGFSTPLSIGLSFGFNEAVMLLLVNVIGLLGGISFSRRFLADGAQPMALYLLLLLGANGLILTRDLFNSFVFIEILSISGFALIAIRQSKAALSSGLKYMMAGGISSALLLLGIIFVYRYTGTLNIDSWIGMPGQASPAYQMAIFLVIAALFIDLKPFPANGWALDVYQSAHGGMGAVFSAINSTAIIFLIHKLVPVIPAWQIQGFAIAGLVSFVFANLTGLRQTDAKRLLGYSSTGQSGLILLTMFGLQMLNVSSQYALIIALGFMINNALAKSGLFWMSEMISGSRLEDWAALRKDSGLVASFGIFAVALVGLPPFPGFFAKWMLIRVLVMTSQPVFVAALLIGSLFETVYMFRWLGLIVKAEQPLNLKTSVHRMLPPVISVTLLLIISYLISTNLFDLPLRVMYPVLAMLVFSLLDFIPVKIKGILAIGLVGYFVWSQGMMGLPLMGQIFTLVLVGGAALHIFAYMHRKGNAEGLFPPLIMLILALGNLVLASTRLELFYTWELMTIASYVLVLRGKHARKPAQSYIVFSLAAAYLILSALMLIPEFYPGYPILLQAKYINIGIVPLILAGLGLLIKTGALGVHVWLPNAYSEAEDESTSLISSVVSKAGIMGLMIFLIMGFEATKQHVSIMTVLGWIGVLTAFGGALMAAFSEDVKKLIAYSSMSQMGYIILGLSLMSHLGWVSALYLTVNHLLFKALIFLAIAGVILRTGTRNMYEMGGLIKKMPISFISVLLGIIAVSGVPPLTGFGSKWFIYTSLLEQGRYLQAGLAFFSSAVAFLYLYKLIHTVFLGQAKPNQYHVKEAPVWYIIPQAIFMMLIMAFSMLPNLLTMPLSTAVGEYLAKPEWLSWQGYNLIINAPNLKAYWNGNLVMYVTMGVFMVPLAWLLLVNARTQKVKQFNIVFAAERPYKPWTTHFAYAMFAHYYKALGGLVKPRMIAFWDSVSEGTQSFAATLARIYTGNGQTYLLHIFLYLITLYLLMGVAL